MAKYMRFGVKVFKNGKQVASAQNLEVLSRYHRTKGYVTKSSIKKLPDGGGMLYVSFSDGARAQTKFADYDVLKDWLSTKRKRSGWA